MIIVNRTGADIISGSYASKEGAQDFAVPYSEELFKQMTEIASKAGEIESMDEYTSLLEEFVPLTETFKFDKVVSEASDQLYVDQKTDKFYMKTKDGISSVPLPKALVDRILQSHEKGIDFSPLLKFWSRFLTNPKLIDLNRAGKTCERDTFAKKVFNYVNLTYCRPDKKEELMSKQGLSEERARELATVYQVKITNEGLLNCFKVSQEVDWKYEADEDGNPVKKPLYTRTFDALTGEVTSEGKPEKAEDRVFIPAVMGTRGAKFYCENIDGAGELGHVIKIGKVHRLPDWSFINTDDNRSCVKGLHVGGLNYISCYSGEIHDVFVDPADIGAVPDDSNGAIRCVQYFVHSVWGGVNGSIYHSSKYAALTDKQWAERKKTILEEFGTLEEELAAKKSEIENL